MQVDVKPEVKELIDAQIARGHYRSPSDLVERAIELLREQDQADDRQLADLRDLIAIARAELDRGEEIEYRDAAALIEDIHRHRSDRR